MRLKIVLAAALVTIACDDKPKPQPAAAAPAAAVKPADATRYLPHESLVESKVIDRELMQKSFMPGGTLAHYKKGKLEYDVFLARMADANAAAFALPDWRKSLTDAKLVPSFGGYFGSDGGRPVFVFAKGVWLAGIAGLQEKDADGVAREVASRLN